MPSASLSGLLGLVLTALTLLNTSVVFAQSPAANDNEASSAKHYKVLILGGGVAGVMAAHSLHTNGIEDYAIVEARHELGGRMQNYTFGIPGKQYTVELGPNWIQGTVVKGGTPNPILTLAQKANLTAVNNDLYDDVLTYDWTGYNNYTDVFNNAVDAFDNAIVVAGARVANQQVDMSLFSGYSMINEQAQTPQEAASEYWQVDFNNNLTYVPEEGGFSEDNLLCVDQRGYKVIIQHEAEQFVQPQQVLLNSTVKTIAYNDTGVAVTTTDGATLTADYVICTFSVGVLQHQDVIFKPALPAWKEEAINSVRMATYTKIFLQFPEHFWFDTEVAVYADPERGRYPVWQSLDHPKFFPGSGILFVTVTGDFALRCNLLTDDQVKEEIVGVLRSMYPNVTIPEPLAFHYPRWSLDPLFRGSYSNWPPSFVNGHAEDLRASVGERLWFAGEATSLKYYGFLHGAYYEGVDAGNAIAQCINNGTCETRPTVESVTNPQPYLLQLPR
ncbi:amine oxidase [Coniophora puteana RWD-64-598 SS2]|uniref:Amine oxidase n=1 Tax=Coniophora puteana (strain RWD-64-598) TaxID=741705 RepID=A0A5M3MCE1_CONPW|nr:amine oxidase [Coniophora puteana RWD-64-598 SS2]EIW76696.1 amine oxidase [Coniophora puteana RWD-64-598 SS2]